MLNLPKMTLQESLLAGFVWAVRAVAACPFDTSCVAGFGLGEGVPGRQESRWQGALGWTTMQGGGPDSVSVESEVGVLLGLGRWSVFCVCVPISLEPQVGAGAGAQDWVLVVSLCLSALTWGIRKPLRR